MCKGGMTTTDIRNVPRNTHIIDLPTTWVVWCTTVT